MPNGPDIGKIRPTRNVSNRSLFIVPSVRSVSLRGSLHHRIARETVAPTQEPSRGDDHVDHQDAASAARLLTVVERAVSDRLRATLVPWELDLEEWRVLSLLSDGEGHTMAETAEFALLSPPTLTKAVNRLVSNNLVHRRTGTVDRRQVLIRLTARGKAKHDAAAPMMNDAAAMVFPSESDRELLQSLLRALETNAKTASITH
ncbi:hypothetical protein CH260_09335 [Rhodococcus sp. 05-2256-B2]|nr:hypothetical protein CH258_16805 [Rhodococcus sp. 05-2256-B4]OZD92769.1 hypothetical protein CH257_12780 [Rhodococcus sp. 05-2256-B3]OZD97901.1 hypothetical protein CH260_09335 [Rhodococcus sp. 05-2256-B2]OZE05666.1 hypothetical protein CH285_07945 [Rhodococcus sp. 05-2256-B1]